MERTVRTGERGAYVSAVAGLWQRLGTALARLDRIAESLADQIAYEAREELPSLQYALHAGAELALGIRPPIGAEPVHADLVAALSQARDATAEVAAALDDADDELVERLLPEWRVALFRVRLARLRALERYPLELGASEPPKAREAASADASVPAAAIAAAGLIVVGAVVFTAGAVLAAWPLWAAGLALFAGGFILVRP
jgi:hypothetical protein